jgi:hypothetical protein
MRVSVFDQYGALNSTPVFAAIRAGLDQLGIEHTSHDTTADVAIIWSMVWSGRMRANQEIWQQFRATNRPIIVAEVGMLQRGQTWKLGINGTGANAFYGNNLIPNRAATLGLQLKPWTMSGNNIVIACQRHDSEQWTGQPGMQHWLMDTVRQIRLHTDRPIVIRAHPRQNVNQIAGCLMEKPRSIPGTYDSFDFDQTLQSAWAIVNHNSGPGSQAVISGVPAFVGTSSLAAPVANLDLAQIENPLRPDRDHWLNQLAHTEWTTQEIVTGFPLKRLLGL